MPSLVLFGYPTLVAGDDLRVWAFISICLKLAQFSLLVPLLVYLCRGDIRTLREDAKHIRDDCDTYDIDHSINNVQRLLLVYVVSSLIMAVIGIGLETRIWKLSETGTPTIPGKRTQIRSICHINLTILAVARLFLLLFGFTVKSSLFKYCNCGGQNNDYLQLESGCSETAERASTILSALVNVTVAELSFVLALILYLGCKCLPKGCLKISSVDQWKCFCRCCCTVSTFLSCCLMGGRDSLTGDFSDIALILADIFDGGGYLDVVPSDVVMGLIMVSRVQAQKRVEAEGELMKQIRTIQHDINNVKGESFINIPETSMEPGMMDRVAAILARKGITPGQGTAHDTVSFQIRRSLEGKVLYEPQLRNTLHSENSIDKSVIAEGARFMRLSLAIYTWAKKSIDNPCTGLCEISTFSAVASIRGCCKKHPQFVSDNPCRFHQTTLMRESGLDETEVVFAQFKVGFAATPYCIVLDHDWRSIVIGIRGTLSLDDLLADVTIRPVSLDVLGKRCGFDGTDRFAHSGMLACSEWIYNDIEKIGKLAHVVSLYSSYEVKVTGHSLGAGCAAILALLLRPKYPFLRVLAFSPPGCVMTKNAVDEGKEYTTSYVLDCDVVPRLSIQSVENLRNDVLDMIDRIKVPKRDVISSRRRAGSNGMGNEKFLNDADFISETKFHNNLVKFQNDCLERKHTRDFRELELWPPGKIVHLTKAEKSKKRLCTLGCLSCSTKEVTYAPCWADTSNFREIRMSNHFLNDHEPAMVLRALETMAEDFGLDSPYNECNV